MASPELGNDAHTDTQTDITDLENITFTWDDILPILELCAGIDTMKTLRSSFSNHCCVSIDQLTGLRDASQEVRAFIGSLVAAHFEGIAGTEGELAEEAFEDRKKEAAKRKKETYSYVDKLDAVKSSVEKSVEYLNDKDLQGLQKNLKGVEQIIGKKRNANEICDISRHHRY